MLKETTELKAKVSDDEGLELTLEMVRRQIIDAGQREEKEQERRRA